MKKNGIFYILPLLFLYIVFLIVPSIQTVIQYFGGLDESMSKMSLDVILKTIYCCSLSAFFQVSFSVLCLMLILKFKENIVISQMFLVFGFIPSVAWTIIFMIFIEGNFGEFSFLNQNWGINIARIFIENDVISYSMVAFFSSVQWIGFHSLMYYMILKSAPKEIFCAARMDGLTLPKVVLYLFYPYFYPLIGIVTIATIFTSIKVFEVSYVLGKYYNAETQNLFTLWFDSISTGNINYANNIAVSITLFLSVVLVSLYAIVKIFYRMNRRPIEER